MARKNQGANHKQRGQWPAILALCASALAGSAYLLKRLRQQEHQSNDKQIAPGPKGLPLRALLPAKQNAQLNSFVQMQRRYGDVVRFQIGFRTIHLISHPDAAKHILQDNNRNYLKGRGLEKTKKLLGNGLLTSEKDYWRRQRRLIQPVFHRRRIAAIATTMTQSTANLIQRWQEAINTDEPVNVAEEMMRLTLDIVSRTLFSTALTEAEFDTVSEVMRPLLHHATRRITSPFDFMEDWPTPANRQQEARVEKLNQIVYRIIAQRRRSGEQREDLLGLLMAAQDEDTGEAMNDKQLRDEVMTIFLAGHETTANLLSFTWALLSQHVATRRQLEMEIDSVLQGNVPTADDVPQLVCTQRVIQEALRLYPPAWIIGRQAIEDDEVGGYYIPAGSGILISPYIIHRHAEFWQNPEGFDPLRFTEDRSQQRPRYAYIPFGGGPRLCIGSHFALTEATLILAMIMQKFRPNLVPGSPVESEVAFTLRPKDGIWMTIHPRT